MLKNKSTKKIMLTTMIISLSLALNYSCSNTSNNTSTPNTSTKNVDYGRKIVGKATFPETRKAKVDFRIKANTSEVSKVATISLILPHDATTNQNKTIATGMTDANGNFLIDTTKITLTPNTIYILEASKRSETNNIMTIRTLIKWNGNEWAGIAQSGEVLIDQNTTALSAIANFTNTQSESLILSLPVEEGITTGADIANTSITKDDIKNVGEMVSSILQGGRDPIALLRYDASKAYKYYVDQTYNYKSLTTDNGCNGCSFIGADLKISGASLAGKDLSYADLRGQDLSQADLSGTILIGANLEGATLPQDLSYLNLSYTNLKGQDLTQSDVTGTNFTYSNLENCILSKESEPKDLTKARFTGASFKNSELTGANLSKVHLFEATFDGTKIKQVNFEKADMTGADLSNVYNKDFEDVSFNETNLTGASFKEVDISEINLTSSKLQGVNFSKTTINKSYINYNLSNCNFSEANITSTSFYGVTKGSNFNKAKISYSYFSGNDCTDCDFSEAEFTGTGFTNSNLESSSFEKAIIKDNLYINQSDENISLRKANFKDITIDPNNNNSGYGYNEIKIRAKDLSYADFSNSNIDLFIYTNKADYVKFDNSKLKLFQQNLYELEPFNTYRHVNELNFSKNLYEGDGISTKNIFSISPIKTTRNFPSIMYSDISGSFGFFYSLSGSHNIWLLTSRNFMTLIGSFPKYFINRFTTKFEYYYENFSVYNTDFDSNNPIKGVKCHFPNSPSNLVHGYITNPNISEIQSEAESLKRKYDVPPESAIENASFVGLKTEPNIIGIFYKSVFSNFRIKSFYGYLNNSKFDSIIHIYEDLRYKMDESIFITAFNTSFIDSKIYNLNN